MNLLFISLKVINNQNEMIDKIGSRKTKRIYHFIQAGKFKDCLFKLKVNYNGSYKNEGQYKAKKDLIRVLKAFTEKV